MRGLVSQTFSPHRLHRHDQLCWAVVGDADGAILAVDGKLLMRLTFDEARRAAGVASADPSFQSVDTARQPRTHLKLRGGPRAA